jgi:hypothetical protein
MDRARKYKVMVDGQEVGRVGNGESESFEVAPGHHEVHMAIDWTRSPSVELDVPPTGDAHLTCAANANPFTALWYITGGRKKYVTLEEGQPA